MYSSTELIRKSRTIFNKILTKETENSKIQAIEKPKKSVELKEFWA
jgi:hypothetical protein